MKRLLITVIVLLCLFTGFSFASAQAQNSNGHNTVGQEQAVDQLLLDLFNKEISNAVANYYKKGSISFQYDWWDKDYDVVEVDQSEKGHVLESPFVVKFTVMPTKTKHNSRTNTTTLGPSLGGTDTRTFGVEPGDLTNGIKIKMLNYEHNEPKQ
ncbi:DUF3888 domain-containing protein [Halobacillus shinanisalinarum]|uniref:DUF3888 domain-containing protein n=1 Tax=Halobacillus shinanisalinarum TaxID=2932258 RepID=A0ABY4GVL3_9BACI|nr:DUF3888 domain-containing protein [Halobacillus shinanisalinarum]UOQ92217.1 DUF3888 domain-containing protein [Halobacillus shinanisalinarum]